MMKKNMRITAAAAVLVLSLSACGGSKADSASGEPEGGKEAAAESTADREGFLNVALVADIQTADVHKTSKDYEVPLNIFDRLVEVELMADGSTKLSPSLAKSWDISEDGLVYTFHLNEGVKFHNGADFTSEDVVYSLTRILNAEGAVNGDFVSHIKGSDKVMDGSSDKLEGVRAVDDYTVEVTLGEPYAGFLACLSSSPVCMMDSEATESAGENFGLEPELTAGTGPFRLAEWNLNDSIVLVRNEDYWKGAPALPGVVIKIIPDTETQNMMFKNGELDILDFDFMVDYVEQYKAEMPGQLVNVPRVGITYFTFNQDIVVFSDARVRKAVSMAIDRQSILDSLWGGMGSIENGIFPKGLIGHNPDLPRIEYNPEAAKALLAEAGYPEGFDMEISADSSASDTTNSCLEIIAAQLQEIGINAEIKNYDESTWLSVRKAGKLGSFMSTWTADYNDPDNFIYTFFGNADNSRLRSINYADSDIMARVEAARVISDNEERIAEYRALEEKIVSEDSAWLPMFAKEHYYAVAQGVENFTPNWAGMSDLQFYSISKTK